MTEYATFVTSPLDMANLHWDLNCIKTNNNLKSSQSKQWSESPNYNNIYDQQTLLCPKALVISKKLTKTKFGHIPQREKKKQ